MHARTEDLLKIRDGEPVDAELRERVLACPQCSRELERLRRTAQALAELPDFAPPPGVWERVLVEAEDGGRGGRGRYFAASGWGWTAGAAAAAVVAAVAIGLLVDAPRVTAPMPEAARQGQVAVERAVAPESASADESAMESERPPSASGDDAAPDEVQVTGARVAVVPDDRAAAFQAGQQFPVLPGLADAPWSELPATYAGLIAESARLDRRLAELPSQRRVMSAETAATIADLEDQIAWLDEQLTWAAARGAALPQRQALWSERVEVMNALVQVRSARVW